MPGPIVHLIVQQRLEGALRAQGATRAADLLASDPGSPYSGFGSMGPDFLFFSLAEYGTPLDELVNFIFKVYDTLEPLVTFYEENVEPVKTALEDALRVADAALFQGLVGRIRDVSDRLTNAALLAIGNVVTRNIDLYYPFFPKVQQGLPEDQWYWFDFLHYRRTGRFASTMWDLSAGDDDLQRFVLGYASHIASDVAGHPFINAVTGGPYRSHWQRHKLVENWVDAYARRFYGDTAQTQKALRLGPRDHYLPGSISGSYYSRLTEFSGGRLPDKLTRMFRQALERTYAGIAHPVMLTEADLDSTYRLWLKWFERSTSFLDANQPPIPPPPPGGPTLDLIKEFADTAPKPPGRSGSPGSWSLVDILKAIIAFVAYLVQLIHHVFTFLITHIADLILLPLREALNALNFLVYQAQKGVFEIYDNLRFAMVLGAYLFPEARDLDKMPWGYALLNTSFTHLTGGDYASERYFDYPFKRGDFGLTTGLGHHLLHPILGRLRGQVRPETMGAEPAPLAFYGAFPRVFICDSHPYDPSIERLYDCIQPYGPDDAATHHVDVNTWHTPQFGSALDFSARLIAQRLEHPNGIPDFNLDGDRGYGWKTWRARPEDTHIDVIDPDSTTNPTVDVDFIS